MTDYPEITGDIIESVTAYYGDVLLQIKTDKHIITVRNYYQCNTYLFGRNDYSYLVGGIIKSLYEVFGNYALHLVTDDNGVCFAFEGDYPEIVIDAIHKENKMQVMQYVPVETIRIGDVIISPTQYTGNPPFKVETIRQAYDEGYGHRIIFNEHTDCEVIQLGKCIVRLVETGE